jgi:phosphoglycerol transferase
VWLVVAIRRPRDRGTADGDDPSDTERGDAPVPPPGDALRTMGVMTITGIVVGVVSGFSLIVFGLGVRDLRAWNRISVFLAFFAFTAVAYGLDWLRRRVPDRPWATPAVAVGLAVLLVFGLLDQVSPAVVPDYRATQARWRSDGAFVARLERDLPKGAQIFELPYRFFPEMPQGGNLGPYDMVRMYLHSDDLNWSFGGMAGRESDWQASTARRYADAMLDRLAAVGFDGLVYDLGANHREGEPPPEDITATLRQEPVVSRNGELAFWDLRPHRRDLERRIGAGGVRRLRAEALADRSRKPY